MKMKKHIETFNSTIGKMDEKIQAIRNEVAVLEAELKASETKYQQMLLDDSTGAKEYTTEQINKPKLRADELKSQIQTANERIEMLLKAKSEKMSEHIALIKDEYRKECGKFSSDIEAVFLKARGMRAELILTLLEAHEKYKAANDLRRELNKVERSAGIGVLEGTSKIFIPDRVPVEWLNSPRDYGVIPSERELNEAYREGKLDRWVAHYANTGEVTTNDDLNNKSVNPEMVQAAKGFFGKVLGKN